MSARTPFIHNLSWLAAVPQLLLLAAAVLFARWLAPETGVIWGAGAYLLYSLALRVTVTRRHRAGIALIRRRRFHEAIPHFQASLAFMDRHPWLDRARSILLLSAAAMSFREMALINLGYCYTQLDQGEQAVAAYREALARNPDNGAALAALRFLEAGRTLGAP
ncbi:MAG: tetratricopeptide repeat protein [Deltaproteobacteria bacterium]|nr:tetratricopeptide repeat protein [Deltaproteobacteria bacterium]